MELSKAFMLLSIVEKAESHPYLRSEAFRQLNVLEEEVQAENAKRKLAEEQHETRPKPVVAPTTPDPERKP